MEIQKFTRKDVENLERVLGVSRNSGTESKRLLQKAQRYTKIFPFIPGLLMVGVGNSVAMKNAHEDSDIDLFIVTKKDSMWLVRIFLTLFFSLVGQRKTSRSHAGKFCLSFFVTSDGLDFSQISIEKDIYLFYWIMTMKPIFSRNNMYEIFLQRNNWANFGDFFDLQNQDNDYDVDHSRNISGVVIRTLNTYIMNIFLRKTQKKYERLGRPFGVVIADNMLKFHDQDKRKFFRDQVFGSMTGKK